MSDGKGGKWDLRDQNEIKDLPRCTDELPSEVKTIEVIFGYGEEYFNSISFHGESSLTIAPQPAYESYRKETFTVPAGQELLGFELFYFSGIRFLTWKRPCL
jgi:hypothetical protein